MTRTGQFLLSLVFTAAACLAATTATTLTVTNATGTIGTNITVTGPATLTGGLGNATFSATVSLTSLTSQNISAPYTLTFSNGTITGTLTVPATILQGTVSSAGSMTITGGTGSFSGASGSFGPFSGTGALTATGFSLSFTGPGTVTTGGTGGGGGPATPTISAVQNNYSYLVAGVPNYGIAPGSIFIVKGANLANQAAVVLQSSAPPGLPKTLNGSSASVTVNGTTTTPLFYYTTPGQIALVLPSTTPVGTGTITITNSGQASSTFPIQVVKSAMGLDTLFGTGTGAGVATDANGNVFTPSSPANPGQAIILWGSGIGADTANDDATYPQKQDDLTNILGVKVYVGGVQAQVFYAGRSQYPGVDQIDLYVPSSVTSGCSNSVVVVAANNASNFVSLPVSTSGACSDTIFGISSTQASSLSGKSSVNFGFVSVTQNTSSGSTTNAAGALFQTVTGTQFGANAGTGASLGSCVVNAATIGTVTTPTFTGLDAGSISMNGPAGTVALSAIPTFLGFYGAQLSAAAIPASGGQYTFTGTGGKNVGSFTANLNFPAPLVWTNAGSSSPVNRSNGVTVNWSGGAPGTFVQITGSSSTTVNGQIIAVSFTCNAPANAQTFTVPAPVTLSLPAGSGSLSVSNNTIPAPFTASGLDLAYVTGGSSTAINATYQ